MTSRTRRFETRAKSTGDVGRVAYGWRNRQSSRAGVSSITVALPRNGGSDSRKKTSKSKKREREQPKFGLRAAVDNA